MANQHIARWRWGRLIFGWAAALGALLAPLTVQAAPPAQEAAASPALGPLLLALFAIAFAIERMVELVWNYLEWILLNTGRLHAADIKSSGYVKFKSGTSVLLGAIVGVGFASLFSLHFFAALQPLALGFIGPLPANWDVVLSGIIAGVLAKPIHDIIGVFAGLKNFLDGAAVHQREAAGAAMADGVLKLAQSDAQSMIEVPGVGPTRLPEVYEREESTPSKEADSSPTDRYIEILHNRTSM
ncbi:MULTISPECIES: hypothetical protein [Caldilinea]|jgi:hypothetical protein|uniref:Uncharacterized protein n=1 Tax=Caldilinea aerophila (strain DSM 14535 / JCM 11387 / NBRC 104270 / STL-6-O1) TaxID=926550 RepID=I0I8C3_CALAS|nr:MULTISPECIES: hypothetical protein [Caldilinea]MBO9394265.1 hypothetical protein [Caldilinea sp.]BAM01511.1 hypothetical protein CLDAP_34710 [Caldilinea aerophila DSM 14535 = NBRC 104270]GIV72850.1 MAG: hypothetical protein KatS3mg049_1406 [Caldilinea sp.]